MHAYLWPFSFDKGVMHVFRNFDQVIQLLCAVLPKK